MWERQVGLALLCAVAAFVVIWLTWELLTARRERRRAKAHRALMARVPARSLHYVTFDDLDEAMTFLNEQVERRRWR